MPVRSRTFTTLAVAAATLSLLPIAPTAAAAGPGRKADAGSRAKTRCYDKVVKKLGPRYLANAYGTLNLRFCVDGKTGRTKNVTARFTVDTTTLGAVQQYDVRSQFGPDEGMAGQPLRKNPKTKKGTPEYYLGYKIRACIFGHACGPTTSYHWKIRFTANGEKQQTFLGSY